MKFNIQHSRLKVILGIFSIVIMLCGFLTNGCVNAEAKISGNDLACAKGIKLAKSEIAAGKYSVYISDLPKELSPYAEEVFYVLYKKEVDVTNDEFGFICMTTSIEERAEENCYRLHMDSVVQSFEWGVYQCISRDAESLWRKEPGKYADYNSLYPGQAQFPGGDTAFNSFIKANVKYPPAAKRDSVQGTVYFQLDIDSTGKITNRTIRKGVRNDLDSSVLAALKNLPVFQPGIVRGRAVASTVSKPVRFILK